MWNGKYRMQKIYINIHRICAPQKKYICWVEIVIATSKQHKDLTYFVVASLKTNGPIRPGKPGKGPGTTKRVEIKWNSIHFPMQQCHYGPRWHSKFHNVSLDTIWWMPTHSSFFHNAFIGGHPVLPLETVSQGVWISIHCCVILAKLLWDKLVNSFSSRSKCDWTNPKIWCGKKHR